eukprot:6939017-Pyramimonas_sp.AAC.1
MAKDEELAELIGSRAAAPLRRLAEFKPKQQIIARKVATDGELDSRARSTADAPLQLPTQVKRQAQEKLQRAEGANWTQPRREPCRAPPWMRKHTRNGIT